MAKIAKLDMGFSNYIQRLIKHDLENNTMAEILRADAKRAA